MDLTFVSSIRTERVFVTDLDLNHSTSVRKLISLDLDFYFLVSKILDWFLINIQTKKKKKKF